MHLATLGSQAYLRSVRGRLRVYKAFCPLLICLVKSLHVADLQDPLRVMTWLLYDFMMLLREMNKAINARSQARSCGMASNGEPKVT